MVSTASGGNAAKEETPRGAFLFPNLTDDTFFNGAVRGVLIAREVLPPTLRDERTVPRIVDSAKAELLAVSNSMVVFASHSGARGEVRRVA